MRALVLACGLRSGAANLLAVAPSPAAIPIPAPSNR